MGQPQELRRQNRRRIVQLLLGKDALTRPQLADLTGLSKVTVNAIVQELLAAGLLELARQSAGQVTAGRTPQEVRLSHRCGAVMACDVQPGRLDIRLQALGNNSVREWQVKGSKSAGPPGDALLHHLETARQDAIFGPLRQVVISLPAPVNPDGPPDSPEAEALLNLPALRAWAGQAGLPLAFANDANLSALAAGQKYPAFGHLAALIERPSGTGLGLLLGGALYQGVRGQAGEVGRAPWPTPAGPVALEQLPAAERLSATSYLLASLTYALDLQHLVLGLPDARASELERLLGPLLPPGVSLARVQEADGLALAGAALWAVELGREQLLETLDLKTGGLSHVA